MLFLDSRAASFASELARLNTPAASDNAIRETVSKIITDVARRGEKAVLHYCHKFDELAANSLAELRYTRADFARAWQDIEPTMRENLQFAANRIRAYHQHQQQQDWYIKDSIGCRLGQKIVPLSRVGIYAPGGLAAYPSSVLMGALPATIAGVGEIVLCVPRVSKIVLAAAHVAGVDELYAIGGAQAIAALALGTEELKPVNKIVGPGNKYVTEAKRQLYGQVGIDMVAGPSEVVIIADESTKPEWVAADLCAQAEHDINARAILISPDKKYLSQVQQQLDVIQPQQKRAEIIRESFKRNGVFILTQNLAAAVDIANRLAPEHLQLMCKNAANYLPSVTNAGAVFIGAHSSEVVGDYCIGSNHVLPTVGSARFFSPLGVYDFYKRIAVVEITQPAQSQRIYQVSSDLAQAEGLEAHALAARLRMVEE